MKIKGVTEAEIVAIADYLGFQFTNLRHEGNYTLGVLRMATNIGRKGWRKAPPEALRYRKKGFYTMSRGSDAYGGNGAVCFHGHKKFMEGVFAINKDAIIRTKMAAYLGRESFESQWPHVQRSNMGSMFMPVEYGDACNCANDEHEIQFGTLLPPKHEGGKAELVNVRMIKQSTIKACPFAIFAPEHYVFGDRCGCYDAAHREHMKREWEYTDESFREAGVIQ